MRNGLGAIILALAVLAAGPCLGAKTQPPQSQAAPSLVAAFAVDPISVLAGLGDRSTGSAGQAKAADLIQGYFSSLGMGQAGRQSFIIPVKDYGPCQLTVPGRAEPIALEPADLNVLSTVAAEDGLSGPLVYAGDGGADDLNGKQVAGSIVLMNLDSRKNWINAADLGARAVIYLDGGSNGEPASRGLFQDKLEQTPVRFPRFWMTRAEAASLWGDLSALPKGLAAPMVKLTAKAAWRPSLADNVFLFIPGADSELAKQVVLVEAFYDSLAYVPGRSPGADEACSLAGLMSLAEELKNSPPKRSVLLLATAGHAQSLAGFREFLALFSTKAKDFRAQAKGLAQERTKAGEVLKALQQAETPGSGPEAFGRPDLGPVLDTAVKDEVDRVSTRLMSLRLEQGQDNQAEVQALSDRRQVLRRLGWRGGFSGLAPEEADLLRELIPGMLARYREVERDDGLRQAEADSSLKLKELLGELRISASVSLHLSSHGDGVGAVNDGWLYAIRPEMNRGKSYGAMARFLTDTAKNLGYPMEGLRYMDGLRGNRLRPWRSFFVDNPPMGGEVSALAGLMGLTLATLDDGRFMWGTPHDTPQGVDRANLQGQDRLVQGLILALVNGDWTLAESRPKKGFAVLAGHADFIRQGELFPDRPAPGAVLRVQQGGKIFLGLTASDGSFKVSGLADARLDVDKAVVDAYRFSRQTGEAQWAIDKKQTPKDAYRVKLRGSINEADLIMFSCRQSTLFSMFDPRTFRYFTKVELLDARREAEPERYWFSRLDTMESTLFTVFLEPGSRYKLTLSDSVLARKMILLNSTPEEPEGLGYSVDDNPTLPWTELKAARDMWDLLRGRIRNLEDHGVVNERIRDMQAAGQDLLDRAQSLRENQRDDEALALARSSWAYAARVYNDVEKTQKDVLLGVLFYIALFVPFAYCLERVIFASANIHKRLAGFLGILAAVITVVYNVHPAFKITYNPMVVVMAFFIIGLAGLVTAIIFMRFEQEMEELQRRAKHLKATGIGRLKAMAASFVIGVSNLRRRKVRTTLTCLTLVILTFTIMSFTSVKSISGENALRFTDKAPYQGVMLKNLGWLSLPIEAANVIYDQVGETGTAPRADLENQDRTSPYVTQVRAGANTQTVEGVLGLSWTEPQVSGLDQVLTAGRWLAKDERRAVLLPDSLAAKLDVSPDVPGKNTVTLWGEPYKVVGLFSGQKLDNAKDLDGEPVTPVVFPSEAAVSVTENEQENVESGEEAREYQGRYQHVPGSQVLILPYETVMGLGGQLKCLAMSGRGGQSDPRRLADRFGLTVYAGLPQGTFIFQTTDTISYAGVPNIVIPLAIAVLIVLNTMIGAVYERKREIAVYTAVGLAPTHVAFLFIAEALAFAVISVVLGYLLAQTSAGFLSGTGVWKGMTANYSSLSGVAAMGLVILVVLLSVIYPSKVASDIAIPDVNRSWTMPAPQGGVISATLPFLMHIEEQEQAGGFLLEYYKAHLDVSHGLFSTEDVHQDFVCPWLGPGGGRHPKEISPEFEELGSCLRIKTKVWLAPFDFAVSQVVNITFMPAMSYPGYMEILVELIREAGEAGMWKRLNKRFLDDLRKQMLMWRSLDAQKRETYVASVDTSTKNLFNPA